MLDQQPQRSVLRRFGCPVLARDASVRVGRPRPGSLLTRVRVTSTADYCVVLLRHGAQMNDRLVDEHPVMVMPGGALILGCKLELTGGLDGE